MKIINPSDHYAVFGNPISHSLSPLIHSLFAQQTQQNLHYSRQLIPLKNLKQSIETFFQQGGKGLNITSPFKEEAFSLMTEVGPNALAAKAINTLMLNPRGGYYGETTDGVGLIADLSYNHYSLFNKTILLLGAGGAIRSVLGVILAEKPARLVIANRTNYKAEILAQSFNKANIEGVPLSAIPLVPYDFILNGISQYEKAAISSSLYTPGTFCYDLSYSPSGALTPFLTHAKSKGVTTLQDGLGLLIEQAAESFYLWRGIKPDTLPLRMDILRSHLNKK